MKYFLCLCVSFFLPVLAQAEDYLEDSDVLRRVAGISAEFQEDGSQDQVIITINMDDYLKHIPFLEQLGIITLPKTMTTLKNSQMHLARVAMILFGAHIVEGTYKSKPNADKIHFSEILIYTDDYRNDDRAEVASFDFTNEIYKKMNWSDIHEYDLQKNAINFQFTPFFLTEFLKELQK